MIGFLYCYALVYIYCLNVFEKIMHVEHKFIKLWRIWPSDWTLITDFSPQANILVKKLGPLHDFLFLCQHKSIDAIVIELRGLLVMDRNLFPFMFNFFYSNLLQL